MQILLKVVGTFIGEKGFITVNYFNCIFIDQLLAQGPCSFEPGLCGWKDNSLGAYKWDRNKGATVTAGTGPSVDHTCGNASCEF